MRTCGGRGGGGRGGGGRGGGGRGGGGRGGGGQGGGGQGGGGQGGGKGNGLRLRESERDCVHMLVHVHVLAHVPCIHGGIVLVARHKRLDSLGTRHQLLHPNDVWGLA